MDCSKQNPLPRRQRRLESVFDVAPSYFLTICSAGRKPVFATHTVDERIRVFSAGSMERYQVWVDSYVLMPDHMHLIVTVSGDAVLGGWVKALKAFVGNRELGWQEGFFDHVLRSDESRAEKWEYIRMNPVRAGLVDHADNWSYANWFDPRTGVVGRVTSPGGDKERVTSLGEKK